MPELVKKKIELQFVQVEFVEVNFVLIGIKKQDKLKGGGTLRPVTWRNRNIKLQIPIESMYFDT